MSAHDVVIAVVDRQPQVTVVWHVQTAADGPSASGILSGAWILGPGEIDPDRLADLTAGTVVLGTDGGGLTLGQIEEGIRGALAEIRAAAKAAHEANPKLTLPRLDAPAPADVDKFLAAYRGEEAGRVAWAYAMAVAELVETWHTIEAQRRSRKFLQERFGADTRPLPLPPV